MSARTEAVIVKVQKSTFIQVAQETQFHRINGVINEEAECLLLLLDENSGDELILDLHDTSDLLTGELAVYWELVRVI